MFDLTLPNIWTKKAYQEFSEKLKSYQDKTYLEFNKKIVFTNYDMFGIRIPVLREISKKIKKTDLKSYLDSSVPKNYEEIFLRGIVISYLKDYNEFIRYFKDYLQYIDNWAICDMVLSSCKIIGKNKDLFEVFIKELLKSPKEYEIRVGVVALMDYYIEKDKLPTLFSYLNNITHDAYYVHMAIAWMISIMYIKFPKETEEFLKSNYLKNETHNKAIQKIRESTRVSKEAKDYLLKYKRWQKTNYTI